MTVAVRGDRRPHAYGNMLRNVMQQLDPDLAPLLDQDAGRIPDPAAGRAAAAVRTCSSAFAAIAIILAAVGIYGVLAFATGQRNREIGVRRALGAHDRQILGAVMRGALFQLAVGLALGALLAPLMGRALGSASGCWAFRRTIRWSIRSCSCC